MTGLAAAYRDARVIEDVLRARSFAVPVGHLALMTRIEERRLRRLLRAMEAAGLVGWSRLATPERRWFWREGRTDLTAAGRTLRDGG